MSKMVQLYLNPKLFSEAVFAVLGLGCLQKSSRRISIPSSRTLVDFFVSNKLIIVDNLGMVFRCVPMGSALLQNTIHQLRCPRHYDRGKLHESQVVTVDGIMTYKLCQMIFLFSNIQTNKSDFIILY